MLKKNLYDIRFPVGGLDRRNPFQRQPPYTTPDCLNVRPLDVIQDRERGGSRPGLGKAFQEDLGGKIRLLTDLTIVGAGASQQWTDIFKGQSGLGASWSVASWIGSLPGVSDDLSEAEYGTAVGAVRSALTFDATQPYQLEIDIVPHEGEFGGKYQIFLRMNNTTPVATTAGAIAELVMDGDSGDYSGTLTVYVAGVPTVYIFTGGSIGAALPGTFKVLVTTNNIKCYWQGNLLLNQNISAANGPRFGFGMEADDPGDVCKVDFFRVQFYPSSTIQEQYRQMVVASADGTLYRENGFHGQLAALSSSVNLISDRQLQSAVWGQKLFIADNGELKKGGTGGTINSTGLRLDDAGVSDWTTLGIDVNNDVVVISDAAGAAVDGVYKISAVGADYVTLTASAGGTGTCTYRIERAPKLYDPAADTLTILTATVGSIPVGCPLVCRYRDTIVFAGAKSNPHMWFIARVGDPYDFDYSADDDAAAVFGESSDAGEVAQPIKALIPYSDDYLLFGCSSSIWVMRGHPNGGGLIDNVSYTVGVVDKFAWCWGPNGEIIFLSNDGLYMMPPGASSVPQSISRERMPRELLGVDVSLYSVSLAYDIQERGVHIYLTPEDAQGRLHFWFDWESKSFWPVSHVDNHEPVVLHQYNSIIQDESCVLLGCRDGYVRKYSHRFETDDSEEIESYVDYGPLRMGGSDYDKGLLTELIGVLAQNSGDVDWSVRVGETQESVLNADNFETGTWQTQDWGGLNFKTRVRARGGSVMFRLSNGEPDRAWSVERITAVMHGIGNQRLA